MARPVARKGTANASFRQRIPADIKRILAGLPRHYRPPGWEKDEIVISLRTADKNTMRPLMQRLWQRLKATMPGYGRASDVAQGGGGPAGEAYLDFQILEDDPGGVEKWHGMLLRGSVPAASIFWARRRVHFKLSASRRASSAPKPSSA